MKNTLCDGEKGQGVESPRKKEGGVRWLQEERHDGCKVRGKRKEGFESLVAEDSPKAFLMSVAMKTWSGRAAARDLRL